MPRPKWLSVGRHPAKQRVAGAIPGQGTWIAGSVLSQGAYKKQPVNVSLSH